MRERRAQKGKNMSFKETVKEIQDKREVLDTMAKTIKEQVKQSFAEEFLELIEKYYEQGIYIRVINGAGASVKWGDGVERERKTEQIISDLEIRPIF